MLQRVRNMEEDFEDSMRNHRIKHHQDSPPHHSNHPSACRQHPSSRRTLAVMKAEYLPDTP